MFTMNCIPPPDPVAHQDGLLMAELARVNTLLGRYLLRFLDADASRAEPLSTDDERAPAGRVAEVADGLRARAARRELHGNPPPDRPMRPPGTVIRSPRAADHKEKLECLKESGTRGA
jgi:hypothetical protein